MLAPFNAGTVDGERPREWIKNTAGCRGVITIFLQRGFSTSSLGFGVMNHGFVDP